MADDHTQLSHKFNLLMKTQFYKTDGFLIHSLKKCKINKTATLKDTGQNIFLGCLKSLKLELTIVVFANSILVLSTCSCI